MTPPTATWMSLCGALFEQADLRMVGIEGVAAEAGAPDFVEEALRRDRIGRQADGGADLHQALHEGFLPIGMKERIGLAVVQRFRREDRREGPLVLLGIIPIGQRQHGIAGHGAQHVLEIVQEGAVPDHEVGGGLAEMRALVPVFPEFRRLELRIALHLRFQRGIGIGVGRRLEKPAPVIRHGQRLHRRHAPAQRCDAARIGRED